MSNRGQTLTDNGPALFMRCRMCHKLTLVNATVAAADFIGDTIDITIPTSVVCSPCVQEDMKTRESDEERSQRLRAKAQKEASNDDN